MRIKKKICTPKLNVEYVVNVSPDGTFTAYLPEDTIEKLESYGIEVNIGRGNRKGYFQANSLSQIEDDVSKLIHKLSAKKLKENKIVLLYSINTVCSYCKNKNGEIVPNGLWESKANGVAGHKWISGTEEHNSNNGAPYGLSLYVKPRMLNVWEFPDKTEYREYLPLEAKDIVEGSTLDWLNSLCGMESKNTNTKEIDYDESIGMFFKRSIIGICNMNEQLKRVFGDNIEVTLSKVRMLPDLTSKEK